MCEHCGFGRTAFTREELDEWVRACQPPSDAIYVPFRPGFLMYDIITGVVREPVNVGVDLYEQAQKRRQRRCDRRARK